MAVVRTIPSERYINGKILKTSEISTVSEVSYKTNGEACIIVRGVKESEILLDSKTTDHVVIKALTKVLVKSDVGLIDEDYDEILLDKFACVEFRFVLNNWYILSSDGLKQS
jgi:hypothetical protein